MLDLPKISPLGDNALSVDFGNEISLDLNDRAIQLAASLNSEPFPGLIEAVPAYSSVAVFYDLAQAVHLGSPAYESVRDIVLSRLHDFNSARVRDGRLVEIPVDFSAGAGLDLESIAAYAGCSRDHVISIFLSRDYRVYMLGFLPGFAYMGEVDGRIAMPRRASPRLKVPKGSVGIAGSQTGIYPLESPGGWQIVGRTDVEVFAPNAELPCMLRPGDQVRFVPI